MRGVSLAAGSTPTHPGGTLAVSPFRLRMAVRCLAAGGVIAYPTEAVYGLGCDPDNGNAVHRLLAIKGRSVGKGLILVAADYMALRPYVAPLDPIRMALVHATWPGPTTWLMPARPDTPAWLTGTHNTIAVRVTAHPMASALCRQWGGALVSTSANRASHPPARTHLEVRARLGDAIDVILVGRCGGRTRPTTIRNARTGAVIRP